MTTEPGDGGLRDRAEALAALHVPGRPVVLPNVWDAASAREVVAAGFPVVATSSAAVADTLGYADHEQTPPEEMFDAVARVARAVDVPVTADIEGGYGLDAPELVARLLRAGAVGCNLEDTDHAHGGRVAPSEQAARIAAVSAAAGAAGVPVVVNARIDSWLHPGSDDERFTDALERARRYADAGADCVFPILLVDLAVIARFVEAVPLPVNVLRWPGGAPLAALADAGVARVSHGGSLYHQHQEHWRTALGELVDELR